MVEKEKRPATRPEGVTVQGEGEERGVVDEVTVVQRVSSLMKAQTVALASNRQGVRARSSAAGPGQVLVNRIPKSYFVVDLQTQIGAMSQRRTSYFFSQFRM